MNNGPNWISKNESDGNDFYWYDTGDGHTDWYDADGNLGSGTETPSEDGCDNYLTKF